MTQQQAGLVRRAKMSFRNPADLAGIRSGGKFVVLRAGRAYDARVRSPNRRFQLTIQPTLDRIRAEIGSVEEVCGSKRSIAMYRLPSCVLRFLALAMFAMSILPARAQQPVVQLPDMYVTSDNYSIHVSHKAGAHPSNVPVLLIHGSWGNAQ